MARSGSGSRQDRTTLSVLTSQKHEYRGGASSSSLFDTAT